jgi:hypothetical protein
VALKQVECKERKIERKAWGGCVQSVTQKIGGPREEGRSLATKRICQQGEHEMTLKQVWRPRICRMVLKSWELGGRRDQQGPEEGKFGRVEKGVRVQRKGIIGMNTISHRQLFYD